jgi:hypothetical protein
MDAELERYVERASDPRLISGIYNYCHGRCEQCPFTERCLTFREMRDEEARHPGRDVMETAGENLARAVDLMKAWCEREGVDFETIQEQATCEQAQTEHEQRCTLVECDELHEQALTYSKAAYELVSGLDQLAPFHEWSPVVRQAIETIGWYSGVVPAKVGRALHGLAERAWVRVDEDEVQNDWNGSAKAARLAIAESQRAWDTLLRVGQAPAGARLRETRQLLDRLDGGLASRFPRAMEFVRPGFDEPEIAAGALSTLACFEPRRRGSGSGGAIAWLRRVAGSWQRRS